MNTRAARPHRHAGAVASGIIPGIPADEREQFATILNSYARERSDSERYEIRRHRAFEAELYNAGDIRNAERRFDQRLEGMAETPRRSRDHPSQRTSIETALQPDLVPAAEPLVPASASTPRYNAITHTFVGGAPPAHPPPLASNYVPEWKSDNMFISAAGVASKPSKSGGVDSLRWEHEARHHADAIRRESRPGLRTAAYDSQRRPNQFNILNNVPDGHNAVPKPAVEMPRRTMASHSRYTFDVLSGQDRERTKGQLSAVDPRVLAGARSAGETLESPRGGIRTFAPSPREHSITAYDSSVSEQEHIEGLKRNPAQSRAHEQSYRFGPAEPLEPRSPRPVARGARDHVKDILTPPEGRNTRLRDADSKPQGRRFIAGANEGGVHNALVDAELRAPKPEALATDATVPLRGRKHVDGATDHLWMQRPDPGPPERRHKIMPEGSRNDDAVAGAMDWHELSLRRPTEPSPRYRPLGGEDSMGRVLSSTPLEHGEVPPPRQRSTAFQKSSVGDLMRGPEREDSPFNSPRMIRRAQVAE